MWVFCFFVYSVLGDIYEEINKFNWQRARTLPNGCNRLAWYSVLVYEIWMPVSRYSYRSIWISIWISIFHLSDKSYTYYTFHQTKHCTRPNILRFSLLAAHITHHQNKIENFAWAFIVIISSFFWREVRLNYYVSTIYSSYLAGRPCHVARDKHFKLFPKRSWTRSQQLAGYRG